MCDVQSTFTVEGESFKCKIAIFCNPSLQTCVLGAQKNHLIEMVLLSTHDICYG